MVSVLATAALAEAPPRDLMKRLADWADRTQLQSAVSSLTADNVIRELDGDGRVLHTEEMVVRANLGPEGPSAKVVKATRDGKDNLQQVLQRRRSDSRARQDRIGLQHISEKPTPFTSADQGNYLFELLPPYPDDPRKLRIGFRPRGNPEPGLYVGEAKVDPKKGAVQWLMQKPSRMPAFIDHLLIVEDFRDVPPVGPMLSSLHVAGGGGVWFIRRRFDVDICFLDLELKDTSAKR